MPAGSDKVERIRAQVAVGVPVGDAIRLAVGGSIPMWANSHGIHRTEASMVIWSKRPATERVVAALAADLGTSEETIRALLWEGARPAAAAAS